LKIKELARTSPQRRACDSTTEGALASRECALIEVDLSAQETALSRIHQADSEPKLGSGDPLE